MKTALTIAGSDSSGGAGIQADIKTMTCNGVFAMSAITALTAQNTTGVQGIMEVPAEFLGKQIDSIVTDIFPDAVKTGMLANSDLIRVIADRIKKYELKNIVVDPVMVSTSGSRLISEEAISTLKTELLPLATLVTPNIPEAEVLCGFDISSNADMENAAAEISARFGCSVLLKGGHAINDANDYLYVKTNDKTNDKSQSSNVSGGIWFYGKRIDNPNTHGTGCTLSSAIASNLAKGKSLEEAVRSAKNYISGALAAGLDLGRGRGPMAHGFAVKGEF